MDFPELRIFPIIASNDFPANPAAAAALDSIFRIGFGQTVIVSQLFALADIPQGDKISFLIEAKIAFAGMIKKPIYSYRIEIHAIPQNETGRRADAKIQNLFLRRLAEIPKSIPRHDIFLKNLLMRPAGHKIPFFEISDRENSGPARINLRRF